MHLRWTAVSSWRQASRQTRLTRCQPLHPRRPGPARAISDPLNLASYRTEQRQGAQGSDATWQVQEGGKERAQEEEGRAGEHVREEVI